MDPTWTTSSTYIAGISDLNEMLQPTAIKMQDRLALLSQAIELTHSLAEIFVTLGPQRSPDISRQSESAQQQEQIRSLEAVLDETFRSAIEARNQVLAPVSRLTDDVLRLFFLSSHMDLVVPDSSSIRRLSDHAFLVSSVCRRWRTVAIDTAPLWSQLRLETPESEAVLEPWEQEFVSTVPTRIEPIIGKRAELCLLRSQQALMTVEIVIVESVIRSFPDLVQLFLATCTNRVKDLTIEITNAVHSEGDISAMELYRQCIHASAATISNLRLTSLPSDDSPDFDEILGDVFSTDFPRLREAFLNTVMFPQPPQFAILAWCRKVTLHSGLSDNFSRETCQALFRACTQLREALLFMYDYDADIDEEPLPVPLSVPQLRSLEISYTACEDVAFPLSLLRLPGLRNFRVHRPERPNQRAKSEDVLYSAVRGIIEECTLEAFSIENLEAFRLPGLFPYLASIRTFSYNYGNFNEKISSRRYARLLTSLSGQDEDTTQSAVMPNMSVLRLGCSTSHSNLLSIYDFLGHRNAAMLPPIQSLCLEGFPDYPARSGRESRDDGLEIAAKVAFLVDSFSIRRGSWHFDKEAGAWKNGGV